MENKHPQDSLHSLSENTYSTETGSPSAGCNKVNTATPATKPLRPCLAIKDPVRLIFP